MSTTQIYFVKPKWNNLESATLGSTVDKVMSLHSKNTADQLYALIPWHFKYFLHSSSTCTVLRQDTQNKSIGEVNEQYTATKTIMMNFKTLSDINAELYVSNRIKLASTEAGHASWLLSGINIRRAMSEGTHYLCALHYAKNKISNWVISLLLLLTNITSCEDGSVDLGDHIIISSNWTAIPPNDSAMATAYPPFNNTSDKKKIHPLCAEMYRQRN